jgi:signal transduction histidine kinase
LKIGQFSLEELVRRVVLLAKSHVRLINQNNSHQISLEFIDATTEPVVMVVDPERIEDAVLNLILNALEAIDEKGRVTVCLRTRANISNSCGEALIEVTDTGCGIPLEIRNRIFEPWLTTKPGGTGLGLAAVRRTAAAHHGRITFKTRIGRGSKFILALPLRPKQDLTESQT